jgi:hypothetical protein
MSVPLPSPSLPITSPNGKLKTRPTAIPGSSKDISAGGKDGLGQSPGSFSFRRGSKSGGVAGGQLGSSPAEGNWRERGASIKSKGPERTVGGFGDKKGSGAGASASASGAVDGERKKDKGDKERAQDKVQDKERDKDKEGADKEKSEFDR